MKRIILSALFVFVGCIAGQKSFSADFDYKYQSYSGMTAGKFADFYEIVTHLEDLYNRKARGEVVNSTEKFGLMELTFDEFCSIRNRFATMDPFTLPAHTDHEPRFVEFMILGNHFFNIFESCIGKFDTEIKVLNGTIVERKSVFIPYSLTVRRSKYREYCVKDNGISFLKVLPSRQSGDSNSQVGLSPMQLMYANASAVNIALRDTRKSQGGK